MFFFLSRRLPLKVHFIPPRSARFALSLFSLAVLASHLSSMMDDYATSYLCPIFAQASPVNG